SDGGLAIALAEGCFSSYRKSATGATIELGDELDTTALLFGESPSRIVLSVKADAAARVAEIAAEAGVACAQIGTVGGRRLTISVRGAKKVDRAVAELERAWRSLMAAKMAIGK